MKNIVVCIKGVPVPGSVQVDPETNTLKRESAELILNPNDLPALEMAIRLKEKYGAEVTAISMGPPNVIPVLRRAYAMGCDRIILLSDRAFAGADTLATSYVLARALEKIFNYDLVLMGLSSIDGETAQVPPETAAILGIPSVTNVLEVRKVENFFVVLRETEYGKEELEVEGQLVCSVSPQAFDYCRPCSLKRLIEVKDKDPEIWTASDLQASPDRLGLKGSPTRVEDVFEKKLDVKGVVIEGEPLDLAKKLIEVLKDKEVVK